MRTRDGHRFLNEWNGSWIKVLFRKKTNERNFFFKNSNVPISSEDYNTANEPINTRSLLHRTSAFFNQQRTKSNFKLFYLLEILLRSLDTGPQIFLLLGLLKGKKHDANYHIHVMMPNLKEFCQMVPWTH